MNTEKIKEKTMALLQRDPLRYADMIASLALGQGEVVLAKEEGVLLFDSLAQLYLLHVDKAAEASFFLDAMAAPKLVAVHQEELVSLVATAFGLRPTMRCHQAVWSQPNAPDPGPPAISLCIRPLPPDMADFVLNHYSHDIGQDYIRGRLEKKALFGALYRDAIAGFIGLHEEGSMGMLEVLPAFRGQGVARQLLSWLCRKELEAGHIPFSQFTQENISSRKLHEKMGFSISPHIVYWLES